MFLFLHTFDTKTYESHSAQGRKNFVSGVNVLAPDHQLLSQGGWKLANRQVTLEWMSEKLFYIINLEIKETYHSLELLLFSI